MKTKADNTAVKTVRVGDKAELGANFNSTVKRLFSGSWEELLTEIFQNSYRAGANRLDITVDFDRRLAVFHDNGSGIGNSIDDWRNLFCYSATEYKEAAVKAQKPMGVGVLSVLASDMIKEVFVFSGTKKVVIDTDKFWHAENYWESWTDLIKENEVNTEGFLIGFEVKDAKYLSSEEYTANKTLQEVLRNRSIDNPIIGYTDYLKLSLNGEALDLSNPLNLILEREAGKWTKADFKGNELYFRGGTGTSYVNWYGQFISCGYTHTPGFVYYLNVKKGTPLTPKSPTRQGIVQDKKSSAFREFLFETAFKKLEDLEPKLAELYEENRVENILSESKESTEVKSTGVVHSEFYPSDNFRPGYLTRDYLIGLWFKDKARTQKLSWVEAGSPSDSWQDNDEFSPTNRSGIFYYKEIPLYVAETVQAYTDYSVYDSITKTYSNKFDWQEMQFGVSSFLTEILTDAKVFMIGSEKVEVKKIYWKPGDHLTHCFYQRGKFGLAPESFETDEALRFIEKMSGWQELKATVFCFEETSSYDVMSACSLIVGAENFDDQTEIIHSDTGLAACFDCGDKDYEDAKYEFDESLDKLSRMIDTMRIRRSFDYSELMDLCRERLATSDFKIQYIEFKYAEKPAVNKTVETLPNEPKPAGGTTVTTAENVQTDTLIVTTTDDRKVDFSICGW